MPASHARGDPTPASHARNAPAPAYHLLDAPALYEHALRESQDNQEVVRPGYIRLDFQPVKRIKRFRAVQTSSTPG